MARLDDFAVSRPATKGPAPPPPSVFAALGVFAAGALVALGIELSTSTRAPAGVQAGSVVPMVIVLVGIAALFYGLDKRRVFISELLAEAGDWRAVVNRSRADPERRDDVSRRAAERLLQIENDLSETGARKDAASVAQVRRALVWDADSGLTTGNAIGTG